MSSQTKVLLLKEQAEECKYHHAFQAAGVACYYAQVIGFQTVQQGVDRVKEVLSNDYAGVVLTSPRAAQVVVDQAVGHLDVVKHWKWYVVGKETAARVRALDETLDVIGQDSGSAAALLPLIQGTTKALLFVCGNIRRDTIPDGLKARNIPFEEICVYETVPNANLTLPEAFTDAESASSKRWIVFFSPSGVASFTSSKISIPDNTEIAAIGKTTAASMQDLFPTVHIAPKPSPEGLLTLIS